MTFTQIRELERRKYPRLNLSHPVRYAWYSLADGGIISGREYWGMIKDLSPEGFCIITLDPPPQDVLLKLRLCMPEENTNIEICASVMWAKQNEDDNYEIGVKIFAADDKKISCLLSSASCPAN